MKIRFDLAYEFGYAESDAGSVQVDALARTSNDYCVLVKLPAGYEPNEFIHDGVIACSTDFLSISPEQIAELPLWDANQSQLFADWV